jgi:hypothetical protein
MARVVIDAYDLPRPTPDQLERIEETLPRLEAERAERLEVAKAEPDGAGTDQEADPRAPEAGGSPAKSRTGGAHWRRRSNEQGAGPS